MVNSEPVNQLLLKDCCGIKTSISFGTNAIEVSDYGEQKLAIFNAGQEPSIDNSDASNFGTNLVVVEMV